MNEELLRRAYGAFNARNADAALALMQPGVCWANSYDGFVRGHGGLREFWRRQWKQSNPRFEPLSFHDMSDSRMAVDVCQRLRHGNLLEESVQRHVFTIRGGLIETMELGQG